LQDWGFFFDLLQTLIPSFLQVSSSMTSLINESFR